PRRHSLAGVHHRLAEPRADTAADELLRDHVAVMRRAHVEDRRRSTEQELRDAEPHARAERGLVERCLERPHAGAQPVEERHVLREAAEDRLHEMDVRLHETRHEHAAASTCASWPAPLVMSRGSTPAAAHARRRTSAMRGSRRTGGRSRTARTSTSRPRSRAMTLHAFVTSLTRSARAAGSEWRASITKRATPGTTFTCAGSTAIVPTVATAG